MNTQLTDTIVKGLLALSWSAFVMWAIGYIIVMFGKEKEILTLIIGIISGTILGGIFGVYFASSLNTKPHPGAPGTTDVTASFTATTVQEDSNTEIKK